jgi:hypothetical protein
MKDRRPIEASRSTEAMGEAISIEAVGKAISTEVVDRAISIEAVVEERRQQILDVSNCYCF